MDASTIRLTLTLATATTGLLAVAGIPLAYWLATTRARWRPVVDAVVALPLLLPPRTARLALAAVLLMAATGLVNLAPPNPYFADTLRVWAQGHFLNFNGLTRLVSAAWPFAALGSRIRICQSALMRP